MFQHFTRSASANFITANAVDSSGGGVWQLRHVWLLIWQTFWQVNSKQRWRWCLESLMMAREDEKTSKTAEKIINFLAHLRAKSELFPQIHLNPLRRRNLINHVKTPTLSPHPLQLLTLSKHSGSLKIGRINQTADAFACNPLSDMRKKAAEK